MLRITKKSERVDADVIKRLCMRVREIGELTQPEVAAKIGASVAMVQRIEQGIQHTFPRELYDVLVKLEEELQRR